MTGSGCQQVAWLTTELAEQVRLVHTAIGEESAVLLGAEGATAEHAQAAVRALAQLRYEIEQDGSAVAARNEAGPAQDARETVLGAHVGTAVEDLAGIVRQLIELAWQRRHRTPMPPSLLTPLREMSKIVLTMLAGAAESLESGDTVAAPSAAEGLREVARHRQLLYGALINQHVPADLVDTVDATLLSCRLERCANLAASIVDHVAWTRPSVGQREI